MRHLQLTLDKPPTFKLFLGDDYYRYCLRSFVIMEATPALLPRGGFLCRELPAFRISREVGPPRAGFFVGLARGLKPLRKMS